jgi:hypothetical protein
MVVLTGRYDGRKVVLDSPVPEKVRPNTRVRVIFDDSERPAAGPKAAKLPSLATLKARLRAGEGRSLRRAEATARKLIGRPRI